MPSSSAWRRARSGVELATATTSAYGTRRIASTCAEPMNPIPTTPTLSRFMIDRVYLSPPSRYLGPAIGRCWLGVTKPLCHLVGAVRHASLELDAPVAWNRGAMI